MTTVLYIKGTDSYQNRRKLAGVADFARRRNWNLQSVEPMLSIADTRGLLELWHPDGIIVNLGNERIIKAFRAFEPITTLYFHNPQRPTHSIACDSKSIAKCATRELLALGLATYAYLPSVEPSNWSNVRFDTYRSILSLHGKTAVAFPKTNNSQTAAAHSLQVARWLKGLPRPIGLFAANDEMARRAIAACHIAGLSIPNDIAIVGVDNDPDICENSTPTLSSISFDYFEAGRLAAETLENLINHPPKSPLHLLYAPLGVVRRESTRRFLKNDTAVLAALERIRREACSGLSAADVIADFKCSRRLAEMRFRQVVGSSILTEIHAVRLAKAKELLNEGQQKLEYVANVCGYRTLAAFSTFFKAETGVSPSLWYGKQKPIVMRPKIMI